MTKENSCRHLVKSPDSGECCRLKRVNPCKISVTFFHLHLSKDFSDAVASFDVFFQLCRGGVCVRTNMSIGKVFIKMTF